MFKRIYSKKALAAALCSVMLMSVAACGASEEASEAESSSSSIFESISETAPVETPAEETETPAEEVTVSNEPYVLPEGMYFSELTGEPISEAIRDQRPIAVMVDNEKTALPHYGTSEADVVYELMNSTKNDRITRLMCIVKDWGSIEQLGSIRSTRPTNILLAAEWNAVLCHDGGPLYNDQYFAREWSAHFSGTFSRINNGKAREFTEYIVSGDLDSNFSNYSGKAGYETTYNQYANEGSHFKFVEYGTEFKLSDRYSKTYTANIAALPFTHNMSQLVYNSETGEYEYYEYDDRHEDAEDGAPLSFKNVILQKCTFTQLDDNGYLIYNCIDPGNNGWYLTNGEAKDIAWNKLTETGKTVYYDENGSELEINTGKTYIALIPADSWDLVTFQ
ncbi:MAG: DUF3048 domain-containing protein [Butyrivibrio sp.]|nr:DUF3048 domain-containing protein [Butyrivibrio sp.]